MFLSLIVKAILLCNRAGSRRGRGGTDEDAVVRGGYYVSGSFSLRGVYHGDTEARRLHGDAFDHEHLGRKIKIHF